MRYILSYKLLKYFKPLKSYLKMHDSVAGMKYNSHLETISIKDASYLIDQNPFMNKAINH